MMRQESVTGDFDMFCEPWVDVFFFVRDEKHETVKFIVTIFKLLKTAAVAVPACLSVCGTDFNTAHVTCGTCP